MSRTPFASDTFETEEPVVVPVNPYYLEFDIGDSNGTGVYSIDANVTTELNTLTTITPAAILDAYNDDLINTSTWVPSITGLYLINYKATLRSVNQDYLVRGSIHIRKRINGVFTNVHESNVRNWGSSVNEADARVFTMTLPLSFTVYADKNDEFRFSFSGQSYFNNKIWMRTGYDQSSITINNKISMK